MERERGRMEELNSETQREGGRLTGLTQRTSATTLVGSCIGQSEGSTPEAAYDMHGVYKGDNGDA